MTAIPRVLWAPAAICLLATAGCNVSPVIGAPDGDARPIAEGPVVSLRVYEMATDAEGAASVAGVDLAETDPGCRAEVYDSVLIVHKPDGRRLVLPHGWYSDLELASTK